VKTIPIILLFVFLGLTLRSQVNTEPEDGSVSYITSQNIYVKYRSTEHLSVGDTLFSRKGDVMVPVLLVNSLSSISAVCTPLTTEPFNISDKIASRPKPKQAQAKEEPVKQEKAIVAPVNEAPVAEIATQKKLSGKNVKSNTSKPGNNKGGMPGPAPMSEEAKPMQDITGRLSVSSYSNFSNTPGGNSQRMRYTFSLNAKNIANSNLSGETYISFVHRDGEWSEIQSNIWNGLKIYSLALNYEFNKNFRVWVGRKINPRISNMGAIDGVQFEAKFKSLTAGILAGSRPDYEDYSFNFNLFQYGAYLSHDLVTRNGSMQSTLAFAEQKNSGKTDRRFVYFQHSNSLLKNLYFFGTIEFDLNRYDTVKEQLQNSVNLSNIYLSLRYRIIKQLSISASYSSRQNVFYYETYKNILDQILDYETLQGYMVRINSTPIRYLSVGASGGYRSRKSDPSPSKNLYGYVTYSRIPFVHISSTASITLLETGYIKGKIYSIGISRDILKGKLYAALNYRYVDYKYLNSDVSTPQNMAEVNLNWIIYKKLALSVNYEGTFEKVNKFNRLYVNLTQRF
jgi:hypothetical protein